MRVPRVRITVRRMMAGVATLGLVACFTVYGFYDDLFHSGDLVANFGGADGIKAVARPDRVEAFRLAPTPASTLQADHAFDRLENYPTASGPVAVPAGRAVGLSSALTSPRSYLWGVGKGCGQPTPGVRLSFVRGRDRVDVLLCFRCNILMIYRGGRYTGGGSFDPIREPLARSAKALFPDDPAIQAIGPRPRGGGDMPL